MILKKAQLKNFMCYYGNNEFEFSEGLNVIIGDNGYGKSKIYDAIYWVMYDKCFDTSAEEFRPTKLVNDKLISDRAVHETEEGQVSCSVSLEFYDSRNEETYILERSLTGTRHKGKMNYGKKSVEKVTKKTAMLSGQIVDDDDEVKRIKKRILPDNIKPYMWFQGEQIDNIIDFKNSETLTKAINVLSDITKFDRIQSITESLQNSAQNELKKKKKSLSQDEEASEELERKIDKKKSKKTEHEEDLKYANKKIKEANERIEDLLSNLDVAQKIKELNNDRENIRDNFNEAVEMLRHERQSFHKKMFKRAWVLKGTKDLFEQYSDKKSEYDEKKIKKREEIQTKKKIQEKLQTRLPVNVPEPIHVKKMLEEGKCLVCDRPAPEGSDAYEAIKSLVQDEKEALKEIEKEESNKYDFSAEFKELYTNGLQQQRNIDNIEEDIADTLSKIEELESRKNKLKKEFEEIDDEIDNYITESSINLSEANQITSEIQAKRDIVNKHQTSIGHYENRIQELEKEIGRYEKKYDNLVIGDVPKKLLNKVEICDDLLTAAISTRNRVYDELIERLEDEANKHYKSMTQDNKSARGIIRLKKYNGNYTPELLDDEGNSFTNINTGNLLLIKLATIMAIISARKSTRDTYLYTLISDAPMSVFGEDYTMGFCKTASQVYRQSIIMSKEFYKNDDLRNQLMESEDINLGKVYMITPNIPESERENRLKLSTEIESLN